MTMASSQLQIPSSSQGFGFILRDRNQNAVVSQKNLKDSVKYLHHHTFKSPISDENSENFLESRNNNNDRKTTARKSSPVESVSRKEKSEEPNRNGASSLVQIWEARLNQSNGGNSPSHNQSTARISRSDSHFLDGDSDRAVENGYESHDSKWGRVADLVRRLSNEEKLTAGDNGGGLSTPSPVVSFSPRLRGRQAFTDLLMQMERERNRELESLLERNAVSKFTQRGRLQSMLRLRNLQRCLAIQDRNRSNPKSTRLNRIEPGSSVLHLRGKFCANATTTGGSAEMGNKIGEEINVITEGITERSNQCNRGIEEATLCKEEETVNRTVESNTSCLQLQETRDAHTCNHGLSVFVTQESRLEHDLNEEIMESRMQETETQEYVLNESNEMDQCLERQEISYVEGWEDQEEYEYESSYYGETNNDWVVEISRPRSHWEELRKSRYLEVMNTRSEKEDIRRLLERRTVTDFLESGLREQIEKLMMSRVEKRSNKHSRKWELQQEVENGLVEDIKEAEEALEQEDDKDDSSRSSSSHMFASSPAGSWSSQDTGVTSTHLLAAHNPRSPDIDLISCMSSQIQQLQREMSLLRDSVRKCLDANTSLQKSGHREDPMNRKCCLCNETQVEAVLYRCGHMCTCLKCANDLHWSGGNCPICRAQIVDVVRVFFHTRN